MESVSHQALLTIACLILLPGLAACILWGRREAEWLKRELAKRKGVEGQLRKMLRAVEQSPSSIVITDVAGNIEYVNPKFCALTGYSPEEVAGRNPRVLKSGQMAPEVYSKLWETLVSGHEWRGDLHNKKKNGELYWESASISPILGEEGRIASFIAIKEDITARKRAEEALESTARELQAAFQVASVGMAQADPQTGRWLRVNHKMCAITGYSAEELLKMRVPELTHPDDRDRDWRLFQEVVAGHQPDYRLEKRYIRKDGTTVWVNVNVSVIRNGAGLPTRTMAAIEDITERKRAQEERETLVKSLEEALVNVKTLSRLMPICASCKRIRDDKGYWSQVEVYLAKHSEAKFTHGLCPTCVGKLYPELAYDLPLFGPNASHPPGPPHAPTA